MCLKCNILWLILSIISELLGMKIVKLFLFKHVYMKTADNKLCVPFLFYNFLSFWIYNNALFYRLTKTHMKINNIILLKCVPITKKWARYTYLRFLTLCAVSTTTVLHIYTKDIYYAKVHDKLCKRTYRLPTLCTIYSNITRFLRSTLSWIIQSLITQC